MTPEGWIVNLGAIIGSGIAAWQAFASKMEARKAKELSTPTGNGFAELVIGKLIRLEGKLDEHIHDHAVDAFDRNKREAKLDKEQRARDEHRH